MNSTAPLLQPSDWVAAHSDYLYNYALRRINDVDTARDLVQDTFLAALEKTGNFEGRSTERTWLTAILRFKIIDVYRKKSAGLREVRLAGDTEMEQQEFFDESGHWVPKHYPEPFGSDDQDVLQAKEFKEVLEKCLHKLPALWMSAFTMKHLDEESSELICESLKVSPANYWTIIHRAKLSLRGCLQKNWTS